MSGRSEIAPYLRLVTSEEYSESKDISTQVDVTSAKQQLLFSDASRRTLGFVRASEISADLFIKLIEQAAPKYIFDLRGLPNFGKGGLTRRSAFALFEEYNVRYFDVAGTFGVHDAEDAFFNPNLLVPALQTKLLGSTKPFAGPVLFLLDDPQFNEDYFNLTAEKLPSQDGLGWEIAVWPRHPTEEPLKNKRNLIFVSHSNPEDNDAALWFSSRLAAEGYEVWSDLTRLAGGEIFWDTIEDVIRNQAAKVLVLLSRSSQIKPGVLDEVNVAVSTERTHGIPRFVIPVRIDDLPFSEVRANLARKNIIDGQNNLAGALFQVLLELEDSDVDRDKKAQISNLQRWQLGEDEKESASPEIWDQLIENSIQILQWPKSIKRFKFLNPQKTGNLRSNQNTNPVYPFINGFLTFATSEEVEGDFGGTNSIQSAGELVTSEFLEKDGSSFLIGHKADANRALSGLIRCGWDLFCKNAGMDRYDLSGTSHCWFFKSGSIPKNTVKFVDDKGITKRKTLVGRSEARKVFWHFGIEARPSIVDRSIRLKPHVIFTEDGKTPIPSPTRQHTLRRGFCRNWWNDRWRDLLTASLQQLSGGQRSLHIPMAADESLVTSASMTHHKFHDETRSDVGVGQAPPRLQLLKEPKLAVGYRQLSEDPREGLLMFGPVVFERNPNSIRVGAIGTSEGLEIFQKWCKNFNRPINYELPSNRTVPFPGFEAAFGANWPNRPTYSRAISKNDLINKIRLKDRHQAVFKTVGLFTEEIRKAVKENDVDVDIWFIVIPDEIYLYGRPASRIPSAISIATPNALGRRVAKRFRDETPSLFPEDNVEAKIYDHHLDFHNQLKARLLELGAVTQILRESSIAGAELPVGNFTDDHSDQPVGLETRETLNTSAIRRMQDPATIAWNLGTAIFFKSGGRPWQVASAREGVCYIGLIYKRDPSGEMRHSCCGAQMFLHDGEGLVFKGAMGPWYSQDTKQFHLSRKEAKRLISEVLEVYNRLHKSPPKEIFIHGRTRFEQNEWQGFLEAVSPKTRLIGVRITRSSDFKLYSSGNLPVKRGTTFKVSNNIGYLWTTGYIDQLGTYQGRETPNPLRIEICPGGKANLDVVMNDVMTLTKMNFNSCIFADGLPVTMRFADAIGDVLVSVKDLQVPPLPFRHYI